MRITERYELKTAYVTRYGSYEFLAMPFRLIDALATFCNVMNYIFYDFLDKFVVVYLDDIVIYSKFFEAHLYHQVLVFSRFRENELYVKKEKCEFSRTEINVFEALGFQEKSTDGWAEGSGYPCMACATKVLILKIFSRISEL